MRGLWHWPSWPHPHIACLPVYPLLSPKESRIPVCYTIFLSLTSLVPDTWILSATMKTFHSFSKPSLSTEHPQHFFSMIHLGLDLATVVCEQNARSQKLHANMKQEMYVVSCMCTYHWLYFTEEKTKTQERCNLPTVIDQVVMLWDLKFGSTDNCCVLQLPLEKPGEQNLLYSQVTEHFPFRYSHETQN